MSLPWQDTMWKQLLSYQSQQRLPPALLLTGSQGTGLRELAEKWCQHLIADAPDLHLITGSPIKIDQIREVIQDMRLPPHAGEFRLCLIEPAEAMNRSAQNALLKSLEEPVAQSHWLLVSYDLSQIAPTIRSRCQMLRQKSLPLQESAEDPSMEFRGECDRLLRQQQDPLAVVAQYSAVGLQEILLWFRVWLVDLMKALACDPEQELSRWRCLQLEKWFTSLQHTWNRQKNLNPQLTLEAILSRVFSLKEGNNVTT